MLPSTCTRTQEETMSRLFRRLPPSAVLGIAALLALFVIPLYVYHG